MTAHKLNIAHFIIIKKLFAVLDLKGTGFVEEKVLNEKLKEESVPEEFVSYVT